MKVPGCYAGQHAKVHFSSGYIEVEHDEEQAPSEMLMRAVRKADYEDGVSHSSAAVVKIM